MGGARARRGLAALLLTPTASGCFAYQPPLPGPLPLGSHVRIAPHEPRTPFVLVGDAPGGAAIAARCRALAASGRVHAVSGDTLRLREVRLVRPATAHDPQCENLGDAALVVRGSGARISVERFSAGHTAILAVAVGVVIGLLAYAVSQIEYDMDSGCLMSC